MGKAKDTVSGGAQGAAIGAPLGPYGAAIGGGVGAVGGYLGMMPGTGDDGGKSDEEKRLAQIAKAQQQLSYMQALGTQQRSNTIQNLGQMYRPVNDQLARLYGEDSRVWMPEATSPLEQMYRKPGGRR